LDGLSAKLSLLSFTDATKTALLAQWQPVTAVPFSGYGVYLRTPPQDYDFVHPTRIVSDRSTVQTVLPVPSNASEYCVVVRALGTVPEDVNRAEICLSNRSGTGASVDFSLVGFPNAFFTAANEPVYSPLPANVYSTPITYLTTSTLGGAISSTTASEFRYGYTWLAASVNSPEFFKAMTTPCDDAQLGPWATTAAGLSLPIGELAGAATALLCVQARDARGAVSAIKEYAVRAVAPSVSVNAPLGGSIHLVPAAASARLLTDATCHGKSVDTVACGYSVICRADCQIPAGVVYDASRSVAPAPQGASNFGSIAVNVTFGNVGVSAGESVNAAPNANLPGGTILFAQPPTGRLAVTGAGGTRVALTGLGARCGGVSASSYPWIDASTLYSCE
jgi:hypothetical protein